MIEPESPQVDFSKFRSTIKKDTPVKKNNEPLEEIQSYGNSEVEVDNMESPVKTEKRRPVSPSHLKSVFCREAEKRINSGNLTSKDFLRTESLNVVMPMPSHETYNNLGQTNSSPHKQQVIKSFSRRI